MWLHIPRSHSVPALECLTPDSILRSAENLSRFCTWNAKLSALRIWLGRLKKNSWLKRLSGLMLEPSQAQSAAIMFAQRLAKESSTSLSVEFHASPILTPENDLAATMNAIYGPQRLQQLRAINPVLCSSRMWKEWRLTLTGRGDSFKTWKALVIELRRDYSHRKNAARATGGSVGSFWGSPQANDWKGGVKRDERGILKDQLMTWPTPKARQTEGNGLTTGRPDRKTTNLKWHAENWPKGIMPQQEMTSELGLLCSILEKNFHRQYGSWTEKVAKQLSDEVYATKWRGEIAGNAEKWRQQLQQNLTVEAAKKRLNPRFAEWLMGWPIGICSFTPLETELTPWLQHTLSALFGLVCRKIETIGNGQVEIFK